MSYEYIEHFAKGGIPIPMDKLRAKDPDFAQRLVDDFRFGKNGELPPNGQRLEHVVAERLELLLKLLDEEVTASYEAEQRRKQKEAERLKDQEAAIARLEWFEKERGLVNCKANADAIFAEIAAIAKGYASQNAVDIAISRLGPKGKNVLQWAQPKQVVELPPPAPSEKLGVCSDGQPQLPIHTLPSHKHSIAQLKDLDVRQKAARGPVKDGWHGGGSIV
jgi:hypothetical protein